MVDPQTPLPYGDPWQPTSDPWQPTPPTMPVPSSVPPGSMVPVTTPYPMQEQIIAQIGEIQVTATTVRTPAGAFPLRGSSWTVTDQWVATQKIPSWAITLAIVGFFCLTVFSLFFLLAKETVYQGVVMVQVQNGPHQYVSRVPVNNQAYVQHVYQMVNYVRSLAAM
jgi:hypothetical protein